MNPTDYDMTVLRCIGIKIYYNMILHQITPLRNINSKRTENKVMRWGNQRELYALARQKILIILSRVVGNTKIGGVEDKQYRALTCFVSCWVPQNHPNTRDKQDFKVPLRP